MNRCTEQDPRNAPQTVPRTENDEIPRQVKGSFLARISREMRTPLNVIIGMTTIARTTGETDTINGCLDKIEGASNHLLGLINDILDMSKIEAGELKIVREKMSLREMLWRIQLTLQFNLEEKNIRCIQEIDPALPELILSDEQRLNQIIVSLLSGAVRRAFPGARLYLTIDRLTRGNEDNLSDKEASAPEPAKTEILRIRISDVDTVMSEEQRERLFNLFGETAESPAPWQGGTGLEFTVIRKIIELMSGTITLESTPGAGTVFTVELPLEAAETAAQNQNTGTRKFPGRTLLLADDIELNREIIISLLKDTGIEIDCASTGAEAVKLFGEAPSKYSLILMDIHMPEMDGYEATRNIRAIEADLRLNAKGACAQAVKAVPIIALTANVFREDVERCLAAGMDGHLGKPIEYEALLDRLITHVR